MLCKKKKKIRKIRRGRGAGQRSAVFPELPDMLSALKTSEKLLFIAGT